MTITVAEAATPALIKALRTGPLAGTHPENIRLIAGGWAATIVSDVPGAWTADKYTSPQTRAAIASAIQMRTTMITLMPDPEDENRCDIFAQRHSPIVDTVVWDPKTVNGPGGYAEVGRYLDGTPVMYELFREGFGSPSGLVSGTTGSGKSETLNLLFAVDRWAHYPHPETGEPTGMVASFLIDPQQGQSFAEFIDDLAAPVATSLLEAKILVGALHAEALRRNRYLARVEWWDPRRKRLRQGRKWWDPRIDGPGLTLYIDEAWMFLGDSEFAGMVTAAARMWRKCGLRVIIATHMPLLTDLGGSMALRDMLTGGFVWVGRTANGLTNQLAFNGRLPADPRLLEPIPGTAYVMSGVEPKFMKARTAWREDWYDVIRDEDDQPIGYPAQLPPETLDAFGDAYHAWVAWAQAADATPFVLNEPKPEESKPSQTCIDAIKAALTVAYRDGLGLYNANQLRDALLEAGTPYSPRHIRDGLKVLRDDLGVVESTDERIRRHGLSAKGRAEADAQHATQAESDAAADAELADAA